MTVSKKAFWYRVPRRARYFAITAGTFRGFHTSFNSNRKRFCDASWTEKQKMAALTTTIFTSLSDMRSIRAWDFSWPTLTKPHRFTDRNTYESDEMFLKDFLQTSQRTICQLWEMSAPFQRTMALSCTVEPWWISSPNIQS